MVIIGPVADDEFAGRPFTANASFARQPASLHCSNFPAAASYIAGTAPTSSLPQFPSSTAISYWASNYFASSPLPQQHPHPWPQLQHAAPTSSGFLADNGLQTCNDDFFAGMLAHYSRPPSAQAPFAHLAVPPPQQPQVQMQFAAQAYPSHQAMAAPVEAVPLANVAADGPALPDTPTGGEGAKPAPRRRGRPRKNTVASSPNQPAPRRKASAVSNSAATSRQVRHQPVVQATNAAVAVATSGQAGPCINPTELPDQEQCPLQSTSNSSPRRRGRPRKTTGASSPNRPAPRQKASVAKSVAESRQLQQPAQASAGAVAVAAPIQKAPCANATALPDQEQRQNQSTSRNLCTWEEEASMVEDAFGSYADTTAPGVRFQPNNEEIIAFLRMKYLGRKMPVDFFKDFNVYQAHPETVQASCGESVNGCWYVFSPRKRRYPNGGRPARSVGKEMGFWKSNTKENDIRVDGAVIGKVTGLTFELGHQPDGIQTPWKMKEYCIPEKQHKPDGSNLMLDDWVVCKIFCNRHDDKDQQMVLREEDGDQLDDAEEDADETEGDEDMRIVTVGQGGQPGDAGEAAGETEGDADMQIVPNEHTLSNSGDEDLCVEDYLGCDPTFGDQDHASEFMVW